MATEKREVYKKTESLLFVSPKWDVLHLEGIFVGKEKAVTTSQLKRKETETRETRYRFA
jgi:hypothetical protein